MGKVMTKKCESFLQAALHIHSIPWLTQIYQTKIRFHLLLNLYLKHRLQSPLHYRQIHHRQRRSMPLHLPH